MGRTYICRTGGAGCYEYHVSRLRDPLDEYVEKIIIEQLSRPGAIEVLTARPGVDIAELEGRRNGLRARLDELGGLFATGDIDGMQLASASRPLRDQLQEAEQALSSAYHGTALEEFSSGADPAAVWARLPIETKRAVAKLLLRVIVYPAKGAPMPDGWKFGEPMPFRENLLEIVRPES